MNRSEETRLDLAAIRMRLEGLHGRRYWRSLDEIVETRAVRESLEREFPSGAAEWPPQADRRTFLKLMAACLALAGANGCTKPPLREIVPYVEQPERMKLGVPLYFATAMPLGGFGTGILVKSREGRPIKADGNARHPASLGGSSVWIQACLLDLYDPDRAKTVSRLGTPSSWTRFLRELSQASQALKKVHGAGLRLLTGTVTSPTLGAQIQEVLKEFPQAKWHQYEAVNQDNVLRGAELALGRPAATHYHLHQARVILSLESDFLYTHPDRLRYAREFTDQRRVVARGPEMNRLYAVESTPTVTGAMADHRLPLASRALEAAAWFVAAQAGLPTPAAAPTLTGAPREWMLQAARDLVSHRGAGLLTVGEAQSSRLHELAHRINHALGNVGPVVQYRVPAEVLPVHQLDSIAELAAAIKGGEVELLLILGGNPAYDAPAELGFGQALARVKHAVHLSLSENETSRSCEWHVPQTHFLESWGDLRSFDGTVTLQQPLLAPLFNGHSEYELLSALQDVRPDRGDYEIVRDHWRGRRLWADFEDGWRQSLQAGVVAGTQAADLPAKLVPAKEPGPAEAESRPPESNASALDVLFRPDPNVWDGRFADNPWLQELPKPLTMLTWDNAILISPSLAERLKVINGDLVELTLLDQRMKAPVWILPGQAAHSVTLPLGYGRERGGRLGQNAGFNAYPLRTAKGFWQASNATLVKSSGHRDFATPQLHHRLPNPERQIYREGSLTQFQQHPAFVKESIDVPAGGDTLYNPHQFDYPLKWGMAIDLGTCIGCNACTMACNIENNIPVVGKDQVALGREMLWIRVDTYRRGSLDNPEFKHQPVPCMHCENAPCEYVCPVGATLHDHEGLNLQVYNRCIGTRYCSNNCPYKVRRFNFLGYTTTEGPLAALRNNPEVTVRSRGVMEKCTYCLQRIAAARVKAGEENRAIREGEVKTACQEACPTRAIVFGIMTDPDSEVSRLKRHALEYPMLSQENTRPRTTYLAKLMNYNPAMPGRPPNDAEEDEK